MSPWKSVSLLVVAVLVLAACGTDRKAAEEAATPPASPDPCDLVAPTTIADVVGPSLPLSIAAFGLPNETTASCSWSFRFETKAVDDVRRPQERYLTIDAETWKGDPCAEVKPTKQAVATTGFGDKAVLDLSVKGATLTFCRDRQLAKITWWAVDWQDGKALTIPDKDYEKTLRRVGSEVLDRWTEARPVKVNENGKLDRSDGPEPPVACDLVTSGTVTTIGVDVETKRELGTPEQGSTECNWSLDEVGHEPGEPLSRYLTVGIQSYGGEFGQRGTERASTAARAFSHGWQVGADSNLGGGAVVVSDGEAKAMAASGAFTVDVTLRARDIGGTEQKPAPTDQVLASWARKAMTDVLDGMSQ